MGHRCDLSGLAVSLHCLSDCAGSPVLATESSRTAASRSAGTSVAVSAHPEQRRRDDSFHGRRSCTRDEHGSVPPPEGRRKTGRAWRANRWSGCVGSERCRVSRTRLPLQRDVFNLPGRHTRQTDGVALHALVPRRVSGDVGGVEPERHLSQLPSARGRTPRGRVPRGRVPRGRVPRGRDTWRSINLVNL